MSELHVGEPHIRFARLGCCVARPGRIADAAPRVGRALGIGGMIMPIRFGRRLEITVVDLA